MGGRHRRAEKANLTATPRRRRRFYDRISCPQETIDDLRRATLARRRDGSVRLPAGMSLPERIAERLKRLPEPVQAEVLDYVEFLEAKQERAADARAEDQWSQFSLAQALRDSEEEQELYSLDDLRERFP